MFYWHINGRARAHRCAVVRHVRAGDAGERIIRPVLAGLFWFIVICVALPAIYRGSFGNIHFVRVIKHDSESLNHVLPIFL